MASPMTPLSAAIRMQKAGFNQGYQEGLRHGARIERENIREGLIKLAEERPALQDIIKELFSLLEL